VTDSIGALRARITLLEPTRVADELGGGALSFTEAGSVWAEIEASGAGTSAAFDTRVAIAAFRVTIRRHDGVRAGWRLGWGARVMRVVGVRDNGGARITLACEEERL